MNDDDRLSDADRQALASLKTDVPPPAGAEAQIIDALRAHGLIRSPASQRWRWIAVACVVAAAFATGALWQRTMRQSEGAHGPRFMLLLYGGDTDDRASRRTEYAGWARSVARDGIPISGEELSMSAMDVAAAGSDVLPVATLPRGYFVVSTPSMDEARRIAESCPHLRHGGRISIRPIVPGS